MGTEMHSRDFILAAKKEMWGGGHWDSSPSCWTARSQRCGVVREPPVQIPERWENNVGALGCTTSTSSQFDPTCTAQKPNHAKNAPFFALKMVTFFVYINRGGI